MAELDTNKVISKKILDKFEILNNTFTHEVKNNLNDRIEIEIGDSKQADFKPQYKFMRWDNEMNFSIRAEEHPQAKVEIEGEKIKYITPNYEVHQYDKPEAGEDGGFEFEWYLPFKPKSNLITSTIQTKELDFFYQPTLTQEEIDEGCVRPENVIGSYAVYHKTNGKINRADGKEYKSGKAFHIYRPKAVDNNGNEVWCDLKIDKESGLLTITIDQKFLDTAMYPVIVDPTFGYTTIGATSAASGSPSACKFTTSENGDITSITNHAFVGTNVSMGCAIYSDSGGTANSKLVEDSGNVTINAKDWYSVNISYSMVASTTYWLVRWANNAATSYYYDTGSTDQRDFCSGATFETWPATWTSGGKSARIVSIYATYTSGSTVSRRLAGLRMMGLGN